MHLELTGLLSSYLFALNPAVLQNTTSPGRELYVDLVSGVSGRCLGMPLDHLVLVA